MFSTTRPRVAIATTLLAVVLMTSACTTQTTLPSASPAASTPPSVASITPVAGAIQPTGVLPPEKVFGGDCTALFAKADVAHIAGRPLKSRSREDSTNDGDSFRRFGTIGCGWSGGSIDVSLKALWDDSQLSVPAESCGRFTGGEASMQSNYCLFDAVHEGVRIGGVVWATSHKSATAISERLIRQFVDSDTAITAGTAPVMDATAWPVLYSCEKLGPIDTGTTTFVVGPDVIGTDGSFLPIEEAVLGSPPSRSCVADFGTGRVSFTTIGGGAWRFDEAITKFADAAPEGVAIEGFSHAMRTTMDNNRFYDLVSGTNYLRVQLSGEEDDAAILTSIASKLDALA